MSKDSKKDNNLADAVAIMIFAAVIFFDAISAPQYNVYNPSSQTPTQATTDQSD